MSEPILTTIPYDRVLANPYQHHSARRFRGPEFDALVESIRVNGVHQPPPARLDPNDPSVVQLQMGHRRFAASRIARPDEPFTVALKELSDLQMLDGVIEENIHRTDLNDIERAELIRTYKQVVPAATNADLARVFGMKDPASISNLVKLLRLPEEIQAHVADNNLPDALARQLVGVAAVNPKAAQAIADKVAAAPKSEKQDAFDNNVRELYYRKMTKLGHWALDWLADVPVEVERDLGDGDHWVGACAGCVFLVGGEYCARKACHEEKSKMFRALEVDRVSLDLKIPVAGADETTTTLFRGDYRDDDNAKVLLRSRKEIREVLRLAPYEADTHNYLVHLLGSHDVTLVTTNISVINSFFAEYSAVKSTSKATAAKPDNETDAQRAKRIEREREEINAKRAERSAMWKSKYDALWLVEQASKLAGAQLQIEGDFLKFVEALFAKEFHTNGDIQLTVENPLSKAIEDEADLSKQDALRRQHIALCVFGDYAIADSNGRPDYTRAREHIIEESGFEPAGKNKWGGLTIAHGFGVTLPDGWDIPPVHRTPCNCWQCGKFSGNAQEKLTKRDVEGDGWIDDGKQGVFCSLEHKQQYQQGQRSTGGKTQQKTGEKTKRGAQSRTASFKSGAKRKK